MSGWVPGRMVPGRPSGERDTLLAEVEVAIRDQRTAVLDELGEDVVRWLAVAPAWTVEIARAAGFPAASVLEFVRRACDRGWCKARGPLLDDAPPDQLFWMPEEVRSEVCDVLRGRHGAEWLVGAVAGVALVVRSAIAAGSAGTRELTQDGLPADLPGALVAWTELMTLPVQSGGVPSGIPGALVDQVAQAVSARDLGRAQDLVAAGEAIAAALAGSMEQALSRARRLLALGLRRRQDERALRHYRDRPELSAAVDRLLTRDGLVPADPADTPWALHLRGVGGVGKTMQIRFLASGRYAAERGLDPIALARVDFDHINPDYPVRRPVQLLLELADELSLHTAANDRADRALTVFRARAAGAHEAVSGLREAGGSPLRHPEVARAVDGFGDVLAELGDVLLILDTCEELAKADMGDPAAPAVRATLEIMDRLHQRAPSLRVLFAGRRPLPARSFLTVQPVDGFTVAEAHGYLAAATGRKLLGELADAMIRQSPAVDGPVPPPGRLPERVSPFDLALYAAWADEDQNLDVPAVDRGSDAYIEGRIIERLDDALVVRALPVLASAGRCRVATIAELIDCDPAALGPRLAEQEWVDGDGDPPVHVSARPALARRLRRYFAADERSAGFAEGNAALAAVLVARIRQSTLAGVDVDDMIAALRLATAADAAELWDSIASQAMQPPGRWGAVLNLTRRILGEWDEEEWSTTPALRAAVVAAHIAASRRDSARFKAREPWLTVWTWADQHPDQEMRRLLRARAGLGLLPDAPDGESPWRIAVDNLGPDVPDELAAAAADAAHRLQEQGWPADVQEPLENLLAKGELMRAEPRPGDSQISAWVEVVRARLLADVRGDAGTVLAAAEAAIRRADPQSPSWPDWIPPDDLLARVRIERGLIAPSTDLAVLYEWESYAADRLATIDGERLASLCLRLRLRHRVIYHGEIERWESVDRYVPDRALSCTAHDLVPPLFVSVAQAWVAAGRPDRALALVSRRRAQALGTRQDADTLRHADAATVLVERRMRLTDHHSLLSRLVEDGRQWPDVSLADRALAALRTLGLLGDLPTQQALGLYLQHPDSWHAWWQANGPAALGSLAEVADGRPPVLWPPAFACAISADIQADLEELRRLFPPGKGRVPGRLADWERSLADWLPQRNPLPPLRSADPHQELRAAMRLAALAGEEFRPPAEVPRRLLAEMAFEEAELTALRLPEPAVALFRVAANAYAYAGDTLGRVLALASILRVTLASSRQDSGLPHAAGVRLDLDDALSRLGERDPALAAALTGPLDEAGRWRYWAEAVQGKATAYAGPPVPGAGVPVAAQPSPQSRRVNWLGISLLGAVAVAAWFAIYSYLHVSKGASTFIAPTLFVLAFVSALYTWYIPAVLALAKRRGIGVSRPAALLVAVTPVVAGEVRLDACLRPWRTAPLRVRARLAALIAGTWLAEQFAHVKLGYHGLLTRSAVPTDLVRWEGPRPESATGWWSKGRDPALGLIRLNNLNYLDISHPWERTLSASLSTDAAGRVEWIRLLSGTETYATYSAKSVLLAPPAWDKALREYYTPPRSAGAIIGLRHLIGRVVASTAGPVMDVTGETGGPSESDGRDPHSFCGVIELKLGQPAIVILQAEPDASGVLGSDPPDDQAEKLRLGADLAADGVPAVLLLPALPAAIAGALAQIIAAHLRYRQGADAQVLLTRLREAIAPHVPPAVLDDVVLFLNEARYQS